jgi:hypothetical protein
VATNESLGCGKRKKFETSPQSCWSTLNTVPSDPSTARQDDKEKLVTMTPTATKFPVAAVF